MLEDYNLMLGADSGKSYTESSICIQTKFPAGIMDRRQGISVKLNSSSERLFQAEFQTARSYYFSFVNVRPRTDLYSGLVAP